MRTILRYIGTCDGDMEKGNLSADVNVSVRRPGGKLGTRCEIKNVNSYRYIQQAIEYEARRQIEILEDGGKIDQETRLFDPARARPARCGPRRTRRTTAISPIRTCCRWSWNRPGWKRSRTSLPELPDDKKARLQSQYGLSAYDAGVLVIEGARADFFEKAAKGRDAKLVANWMTNELLGAPGQGRPGDRQQPDPAEDIAGLVELIETGVISSKIAKEVFDRMWAGEGAPRQIVEKHGLVQVTDTGAIEAVIDALIAANPDKAGRGEGKAPGHRLVRRPGDEGNPGQGQSRRGQRHPAGEAGLMSGRFRSA